MHQEPGILADGPLRGDHPQDSRLRVAVAGLGRLARLPQAPEPVMTVRYARVRYGVLQTPVRTYAMPGGGPSVTLIGTVHFGERAYYDRIHDRAVRLEAGGALVQYEGVVAAGGELAAVRGNQAPADASDHVTGNTQLAAFLAYLGWVTDDEMRLEPTWQNVDMSFGDLMKAAGTDAFAVVPGQAEEQTAGIPRKRLGALVAAAFAAQVRRGTIGLDAGAADGKKDRFEFVVIDERNNLVLGGIPPERDAVLIWGSAHLPGLAAGLEERGYEQVGEEWIRAGRMPGAVKGTAILTALSPPTDSGRAAATGPRAGSRPGAGHPPAPGEQGHAGRRQDEAGAQEAGY